MNLERYDLFERYLQLESSFSIDRESPRCITACPAGCDVKGYLELIAERRFDDAYSLIKETIPFPGIIGRVCTHPCEIKCKRGYFDEPLAIAHLKRFAADHKTKSKAERKEAERRNEKVAVIGAGPAGLTAARDLLENGYGATVFEKKEKVGGMLRLIPEYELPQDILDEELEETIEDYGIEVKKNCIVGEDVNLEDLKEEYDAILIATGLPIGTSLNLKGSNLEGVDTALNFLEKVKSGKNPELGEEVIVIGGGNTAVDVARTARRFGSNVKIVYRRSKKQMPAQEKKVKDAEEEGIELVFLTSPEEVLGDERVSEIKCTLMKLGEPDESGRKRPIPLEGSEVRIKANNIIWAIGQASDIPFLDTTKVKTKKGIIKADPITLATGEEGIFAAGDIVRGPASAVEAIGDGHRAAESIDRFLNNLDLKKERALIEIPDESPDQLANMEKKLKSNRKKEGIVREGRREMPMVEMEKRESSFKEINTGFEKDTAVEETKRCFSCRKCQLNPGVSEEGKEIDTNEFIEELISSTGVTKCIQCGECTGSCPVAAIDENFSPRSLAARASLGIRDERENLVQSEDIWECNTCGVCNTVCPYGVDYVSFISGLRELASSKEYFPRFSESGLLNERRVGSENGNKLRWITDELEVATKGEVYYFSGCISYLDEVYSDLKDLNLLQIPRNAVKILNSIDIVPAVNEGEKCCGHDLLWMGKREKVKELAKANIKTIKESGAKTVVFTCPEGLRTFKIDYQQFLGDLDLKFMHISEFLQDKDLELRGDWEEETLTYHDSCRLKHLGIYEEPREILKRIPNVKLEEMKRTRDKAPCCGVSAMTTCGPVAKQLEVERLEEAEKTSASKLITPCPKCLIHFNCETISNPSVGNEITLEDFTTFIADRLIPS